MIKFSENAVKRAVARAAEIALAAAKEKCPVRTGRLRSSISAKQSEDKAVIYTEVEYAAAVELGTSRQRPQPYLSYGISEAAKKAGKIFREELL